MPDHNTMADAAGIDVSKSKLDIAFANANQPFTVANDATGHAEIAKRLRARGVQRVGLEASGHYEAAVTLIEQITEDIAQLKTRLDRYAEAVHRRYLEGEIKRRTQQRKTQLARLIATLRRAPDLARRLDLRLSIPGVGEITAATMIIRMPELGTTTREAAAALAGLGPFNNESGDHQGARHIQGGRSRLRRAVCLAAFSAAQHWNPWLQATDKRLREAGKHHTLATIARARKLITLANAILARGTPWQNQHSPHTAKP